MKTSILSLSALNFRIAAAVALVLISNSTMLQAQGTKADYERFDKIAAPRGRDKVELMFYIVRASACRLHLGHT